MPGYYSTEPDNYFGHEVCDGSPTGHRIHMGAITLVFSYNTVVAFAVSGYGWVVSENVWSKTTGKHLNNMTPVDKADRLPYAKYQRMLRALAEWTNQQDHVGTLVEHLKYTAQTIADLSTPEKVEEFIA